MENQEKNDLDNCFYSEIKRRETLYENTISKHNSLSSDDFLQTVSNEKDQMETITDFNKIKQLFNIYCRDKIKFTIHSTFYSKLENNKFHSLKEDSILISNPFLIFANKVFPEEVKCSFVQEGIEFSFVLQKKNTNDNQYLIECLLPKEIKVLKRRSNVRIKISKDTISPFSLYFQEKNIELQGKLVDISNVGVGLSLLQSTINNDLMSYLTTTENLHCPIILDIFGEYFGILIAIKHVRINNNLVEIGAEFIFNDDDDVNKILTFIESKKKDEINENKKNKSLNLIHFSKNNIEI